MARCVRDQEGEEEMTWLTRFAQVVAGRTQGKWELVALTNRNKRSIDFGQPYLVVKQGQYFLDEDMPGSDAAFISLSANVADEVLLVITEAEHVQRALIQEYGMDCYTSNYSRLHKALAKLAAKVEQV